MEIIQTMTVMEIVVGALGYTLIWFAIDVGRKNESRIKFMRVKWWIIFALILVGTHIITNLDYWFNA